MGRSALPTSQALAGGAAVVPPPTSTTPLSSAPTPLRTIPSRSLSDIADGRKDLALDTHNAPALLSPAVRPQLSTARLVGIAAVVTCTMCLGAAGAMGLIISLPTIEADLGMRAVDLQWVSSVYSLTAGCFLLLSGRIADIFGRKRVSFARTSFYLCLLQGIHCRGCVERDLDLDWRVHEQRHGSDHHPRPGRYRECHEVGGHANCRS
jgi:hypothetical protein